MEPENLVGGRGSSAVVPDNLVFDDLDLVTDNLVPATDSSVPALDNLVQVPEN